MSHTSYVIDLNMFKVNNSAIEKAVLKSDLFYKDLLTNEVFDDSINGIEIGTKNNFLNYVFITIESFKGSFLYNDQPIELSESIKVEDITTRFGEPYWIDRSDGEVILFYEFDKGLIELQFEFANSQNLSHVTFMKDGVLSEKEQRDSYGVDKPWPPE